MQPRVFLGICSSSFDDLPPAAHQSAVFRAEGRAHPCMVAQGGRDAGPFHGIAVPLPLNFKKMKSAAGFFVQRAFAEITYHRLAWF